MTKWICKDEDSYNHGNQFNTPREALEALGWWENADGTWNEHGDCDDEGYTLEAALVCCHLVQQE